MGSKAIEGISRSVEAEGSETTIEIKIKTLDSQTYTLRVDKQMPVPILKERIASVTGILSEQQRLICRGKVLKDDQLLSAYHVEDGHTLHLVVRQPVPPSSEGSPSQPDPASVASHVRIPSIVIETFSLPDHGNGVPPEISRILSAVLGSIGISGNGSNPEGLDGREHGTTGHDRTSGMGSTPLQREQAGTRGHSDRFQHSFDFPSSASPGPLQPPVIPDSLTTLSQYLSNMRREFDAIGRSEGDNAQVGPDSTLHSRTEERDSNPNLHSGSLQEGLPTPASLAEVMQSTRHFLVEQAGQGLLQLARQLENQENITDSLTRLSTQSSAWRSGVLFHNLGAYLLELGRTIMTLRLGQTPSEAVVNAGPAVFISPSGPNPLMVQPFPFLSGSNFSAFSMGTMQPGTAMANGSGSEFHPRRIDIQIGRAASNRDEGTDSQQRPGQMNPEANSDSENLANQAASRVSEGPSFSGESGIRVVPVRTMVAAVPTSVGHLTSDSSSNPIRLYYPLLGRLQHAASGNTSSERRSQESGAQSTAGVPPVQQPNLHFSVQQQNSEDPARDGSTPAPSSGQEPPIAQGARSVSINILSAGGSLDNQDSGRHVPGNVLQLLRNLLPGGEIHIENASSQGTSMPAHTENTTAAAAVPEAEARATDEGIFLSNLLRQIMPFISQPSSEPNVVNTEEVNVLEQRRAQDSLAQGRNSDAGTSRRTNDFEPTPPNSKRQKME